MKIIASTTDNILFILLSIGVNQQKSFFVKSFFKILKRLFIMKNIIALSFSIILCFAFMNTTFAQNENVVEPKKERKFKKAFSRVGKGIKKGVKSKVTKAITNKVAKAVVNNTPLKMVNYVKIGQDGKLLQFNHPILNAIKGECSECLELIVSKDGKSADNEGNVQIALKEKCKAALKVDCAQCFQKVGANSLLLNNGLKVLDALSSVKETTADK